MGTGWTSLSLPQRAPAPRRFHALSIQFHFPDAGGQLTQWLPQLQDLLNAAASRVIRFLPVTQLDVVTYASDAVIPELGVNGFAEGPHLLHIKVDPRSPQLAQNVGTAVPALFAHEVHHCIRERSVGYGRTLRTALISEGLACHFEAEATGQAPFYATALAPEQIAAMVERMQPVLDARWYNHAAWFFGSFAESIPRHCGYSVGYALVGDYLARCHTTASKSVSTPVDAFFG